MMDGNEHIKLMATIESMKINFGIIFIDTVARSLLGGDENSANDIGAFVAGVDQIKDYTKAAVIGIHHSGKDASKGMRGSSALYAACDTVIQATREEDLIFLKMEKQKDAEPMEDMAFNMKQVTIGIGQSSIVLEKTFAEKKETNHKNYGLPYDYLNDLLCSPVKTINNQPAVSVQAWKDECFSREYGGTEEDQKSKEFKKIFNKLMAMKVIACKDGYVWKIQ